MPLDLLGFVSATEFRFTPKSLKSVPLMRRSTNAIKHSISAYDFSWPSAEGCIEDTYGYYDPRKYGSYAFVQRVHHNPANRVDSIEEGERIVALLENATLVTSEETTENPSTTQS